MNSDLRVERGRYLCRCKVFRAPFPANALRLPAPEAYNWDRHSRPRPTVTTMLLPLALLIAVGFRIAAPQHVRGAPALEEEERRNDDGRSGRFLAMDDYSVKNETEYTSCPEGYPSYDRLGDLLTAWSPNQPEVPEGGVIERLQVRASAILFLR